MDSVVANRDYVFTSIVLEVAFDLAWPPTFLSPKLEYEIHRLLRCLPETMRFSRLDG
jgi:hypothetical protein